MSNNAHDLSNRLLNALDSNYNVVDMQTVNEIISVLEKFSITKELLETTRLGKHVNELRRKTTDATLARRAKVLVKRWRDLVIPNVASPAHSGSNRSSAERQMRRHGGTPLTSPALARQVLSPAVPSPRPLSRPAWGGYESDSQDVILVDDEPDPPARRPAPPAPGPSTLPSINTTPPLKRTATGEPHSDDKTARRDKKPKKRRGHSRAGSGTGPGAEGGWGGRNGAAGRNGCRPHDVYAALVNRIPKAGDKKVKTTKELLEEIQSRGSKTAAPPSPDVMLITDSEPIKIDSPLRNGDGSRAGSPSPAPPSPPAAAAASPSPFPLEEPRELVECTCGEEPEETCPLRWGAQPVRPHHVRALHHALVPGVNGTRAPSLPHPFARRTAPHPDHEGLFASVVPLYNYSDYADDYCVKNMSRLPLCEHIPWTEFAPSPPAPPRAPTPPTPRPYPLEPDPPDSPPETSPPDDDVKLEVKSEPIETLEPLEPFEESERLKAPPITKAEPEQVMEVVVGGDEEEPAHQFAVSPPAHRTVERTKEETLMCACARALAACHHSYEAVDGALESPLEPEDAVIAALAAAEGATDRDALGRPPRPSRFAEWHEGARLGPLIALPYVVID